MGAVNIEYTADCWQVGDYHSIISPYIRLNQIDNTAPLNCSQQCIDPWHLHITFNWHSHDGYRFFRIRISLFFQNEYSHDDSGSDQSQEDSSDTNVRLMHHFSFRKNDGFDGDATYNAENTVLPLPTAKNGSAFFFREDCIALVLFCSSRSPSPKKTVHFVESNLTVL